MPQLPPPPDDGRSRPAPRALEVWVAEQRARVAPIAGVAGIALLAVVVGAVGWGALRPGGSTPPPELTLPRADAAQAAGGRGTPGATASAAEAGGPIVVHVAGAVARPGLYRLPGTARLADAIDAAGGAAADAELDAVNLAARVTDGERAYVPRRGEAPSGVAAGHGGAASGGGPIDLNAATEAQLDDLPGVGPATAAAIVAYRTEHGRFRSVDELLEVRGIGETKLSAIRPKVRVSR